MERARSKRQLALALGVSPATITRVARKGLPVELDGGYDVERCRAWMAERARLAKLGGRQPSEGLHASRQTMYSGARDPAEVLAPHERPPLPPGVTERPAWRGGTGGQPGPSSPPLEEAEEKHPPEIRYRLAKAEKAEIEVSLLRGEAVPRADLEREWAKRCRSFLRTSQALPEVMSGILEPWQREELRRHLRVLFDAYSRPEGILDLGQDRDLGAAS